MKKMISNFFAIIWFFGVIVCALLLAIIILLGVFFMDIMAMLRTGFSTSTVGFVFCFLFGLVLAITGWVPVFRKCYYKLPWLYPFSMMIMMHLFILSLAETILAKGFSVMNPTRHMIAIILMVVQIIVCRLAMCWYLRKYPMVLHKYDRIE